MLAFMVIAYLLPFLGVISWSVTLPEPGIGQYETALTDPLVFSVLLRTLRVCGTVAILSVIGAYIVTLIWVRGTPKQRQIIELCIIIPFWISALTRAFGWLALLSNRGIINTWLKSMGIIDQSLSMVHNEFGVVLGMTHFLLPFAAFPLATAMRHVDERVILAARGLGASRTRIFWQIFLPMTASGVIGALILVFVFALGFFVTPALLGGGRSVMAAELIYMRIFQIPDWGLAAAISVIMMVAVTALMVVILRQNTVGTKS
jgi:putative spermidine/putrescine transport system permease protein